MKKVKRKYPFFEGLLFKLNTKKEEIKMDD